MALSIGIVGLPNVGKSTLFNALVKSAQAETKNFPFTTIDPNVGIVAVPDERLKLTTELEKSETTVPTTVEFTDIAGIIRGAHKGEGLGNKFLQHIREVDAICLVVRAFDNKDTVHVEGSIDPKRDAETILSELELADLETITKIKERMESTAKSPGDEGKEAKKVVSIISRIEEALNNGKLASSIKFDADGRKLIRLHLPLLTTKPIMMVLNVNEDDAGENVDDLIDRYKLDDILPANSPTVAISARIESELAGLSDDDRTDYLAEFGLKEPGLDRLVRAAYELLDLITFFTAGANESRAWTIKKGDTAYDAAGKIHGDFQKKFIRAEVVSYDDFVRFEGWQKASAAGKMRLEGKDYIVKDADVMFFRHS